jgi:hypothetical protein
VIQTLRSAIHRGGIEQICSLDNSETDTQGSIWMDEEGRQLVISFRGTEQTQAKDVLTDINLIHNHFVEEEEYRREAVEGYEKDLLNARVHRYLTS